MAKKIILTEEQLKRISSLINEEFDTHIYDLILDKYNDVGLEGMDEDEIAYLKSGGETEIPASFKEPEQEKEYNSQLQPFDDNDDDLMDDIELILENLAELRDANNGKIVKSQNPNDEFFLLRFVYSEELFNHILEIMGGEMHIKDNLGNYIKVGVDTDKTRIGIGIPKMYYDYFA